MKNIFAGKEKAWASAIAMFLVSVVLQRTGQGAGPTANDVQTIVSIASEIGISVVSAGVAYFSTWLTANSVATPSVVKPEDLPENTNTIRVIEENPL